jgi:hypothetical protein
MTVIDRDQCQVLAPLLDTALDLDADEREIWLAALRLERPTLARGIPPAGAA